MQYFFFIWLVKYSTGWGPPIGGCESFWKVLRTGMTNWADFFAQTPFSIQISNHNFFPGPFCENGHFLKTFFICSFGGALIWGSIHLGERWFRGASGQVNPFYCLDHEQTIWFQKQSIMPVIVIHSLLSCSYIRVVEYSSFKWQWTFQICWCVWKWTLPSNQVPVQHQHSSSAIFQWSKWKWTSEWQIRQLLP